MLERTGFSDDEIRNILSDLDDPIDLDHDAEALLRHGITVTTLWTAGRQPMILCDPHSQRDVTRGLVSTTTNPFQT